MKIYTNFTICRRGSIRTPVGLEARKKRLTNSCLHHQRNLWYRDRFLPKLLGLRGSPVLNRFQHRWCRSNRFCTSHRTGRTKQTRCSRNVNVLLLLRRHCASLRHCLRFQVVERAFHSFFVTVSLLPTHRHPVYLRVPEMVSR